MKREAFVDVVSQPMFDVPYAALLLARDVAYPDLRPEPYLAQLDELSRAAGAAMPPSSGAAERAVALATFLAADAGFQGNIVAYADPRNSFLNDVLEQRQGIPITLSIVYVAVARRLGLDASGVGLPGHFIAGVQAAPSASFSIPFTVACACRRPIASGWCRRRLAMMGRSTRCGWNPRRRRLFCCAC